MPGRAHDLRLAVDDRAVGEPGVERQRRRRDRARPGRGRPGCGSSGGCRPRSRRPRRRSSRRSAGCRGRGRPGHRSSPPGGSGKRYWRTSLISGSASASATMQLRMSPTGGIPSSVAQHARRAAVVGHGHDRGQVAGVLLEPAEQRRQAGPAADRDDPRAAGEEALLVEELDQRLVRIGRPERVGQDADDAVRPERDERDADRRGDEARAARTAGTGASAGRSARRRARSGARSRVIWRRKWANAMASSSRPAKTTRSQRLIPMPGVSQRRRFMPGRAPGGRPRPARSPGSRSQLASSSAMTIERW